MKRFKIVAKVSAICFGESYEQGECLKTATGRVRSWGTFDRACNYLHTHIQAPGEYTGWVVTDSPEIYSKEISAKL